MPGDTDAVTSLLYGTERYDPELTEVKDRQLQQISDSGSTYTAGGYIQFTPSQNGMSDLYVDYEGLQTSFIIPLTVSFPNYPANAPAPKMGFKTAGWTAFVNQVQIDSAGVGVVSEGTNSGYWVNGQRLAIERSADWLLSEAASTVFCLPDNASLATAYPAGITVSPSTGTATGTSDALAYTMVGGTGAVSTAVAQAIGYWNDAFTWTGTTGSGQTATATGMIRLPPQYVHSFFHGLGVKRCQIDSIKIFPNLNCATASPIFIIPSSLPASYTTQPTLSIPGSNSCLLRFEVLTPSSAQGRKAQQNWESKEGYFYATTSMGIQQTNQTAVANVQQLIQPSVVRGERLWLNLVPNSVTVTFPNGGGTGTATTGSYLPTSCYDLYPFAQDSTYALTDVNLVQGSQQVYMQNLARKNYYSFNYDDLFNELQDNSPGTLVARESGGLIDRWRWRHGAHYNVLNISRDGVNSKSNETNSPEQFQALFSVMGGTNVSVPYNLVPVVESLDYCEFHRGAITKPGIPRKRA